MILALDLVRLFRGHFHYVCGLISGHFLVKHRESNQSFVDQDLQDNTRTDGLLEPKTYVSFCQMRSFFMLFIQKGTITFSSVSFRLSVFAVVTTGLCSPSAVPAGINFVLYNRGSFRAPHTNRKPFFLSIRNGWLFVFVSALVHWRKCAEWFHI